MKIVQITNRYDPAIGGVEEYIKNISNGLSIMKHDVYILTSNLIKNNSNAKFNYPKITIENNVRIERLFTISFPGALIYPIFPTLSFKLLKKNLDIIHAHCFWYNPADVSSIISKIKGTPFVFNPYYYRRESLKWKLYKNIIGRITMKADVTILISEYEKRIIKEDGFLLNRSEVIHPGINLDEFKKVKFNIFNRYKLKNKKIVLFVGRVDYSKGIDVLIKAASLISKKDSDIIFFLVGPDFGERKALEQLAIDKGVSDKIIFTGELNREDLISAYKNATVFVLPSRYEAFGIVLIEAMAAKVPVVGSNYSAIPYLIEDKVNGLLFKLEDHFDLAEKILFLMENEGFSKRIVDRGYNIIKEQYTLEKSIKKIENIYMSLL